MATLPQDAKRIEFDPMIELGRSGLRRVGGFILEEFKKELQGQNGAKVYREMLDNCAIVWAGFNALKMSIRNAKWDVIPGGEDKEDEDRAKRVKDALDDMSVSFSDCLSEVVTMAPFGYAPMELVYKECRGQTDDPKTRSKYNDGLISWRKIALRSQETIFQWEFDDDGGIRALIQLAPPTYDRIEIPIEKLLLFRADPTKNNPEGRSILRAAYFEWYGFKKLLETAWIGAERDLRGVPVMGIPADAMRPDATADQKAVLTAAKDTVENLRVGDQSGVVLPIAYDDGGKPLFTLELLSASKGGSSGSKLQDVMALISRHEQRIAMLLLADWILIGHEAVGSRALAQPKIDAFASATNSWLTMIADTFNRHAMPRMGALNGWPMDRLPSLQFGSVETKDLEALGNFLKNLTLAGADPFPDEKLMRYFYTSAGWPTEGRDEMREQGVLEERKTPEEQAAADAQAAALRVAQPKPVAPKPEPKE